MARRLIAALATQSVQIEARPVTAYPVTMAVWCYAATLPGQQWALMVVGKGGAGGYFGLPCIGSAVRAQIDAGRSSATIAQSGAGAITTGKWFHLCGQFASGLCRVLVNGVQLATTGNGNGFPAYSLTGVGRDHDGASFWDGALAEAAIWQTLLSDAQIAALARGTPAASVSPGALRLYWPLWGVESSEPDLSGYGLRGLVRGGAGAWATHAPVAQTFPGGQATLTRRPSFWLTGPGAPGAPAGTRSFVVIAA